MNCKLLLFCLLLFLCCIDPMSVSAQGLLDRVVTIEAGQRPLGAVLEEISQQAHFQFSYNSNILRSDSLVTVSLRKGSVRRLLGQLLDRSYQYQELDNYLIIQRSTEGPAYTVSGYVVDRETGERVSNASVYEGQQLSATLTNDQGYFRLRLRDRYAPASVGISKLSYRDTLLLIGNGRDQELTVRLVPRSFELSSVTVTPDAGVEKTWFGNFLLSSRQRMQSLNLARFCVDKPFQFSLIPGLGTHGRMGAQVINKFSLNVIGGYTAGVNGLEIGSVFNIVQKEVQYIQIAGFLNVAGGQVKGVQIAGFHNHVLDSVKGIQVAGFSNWVKGSCRGVQVSGAFGHIAGVATAVQVSGAISYNGRSVQGMQIAGVGNIAGREANGVQVAGLFNYAGNLRGLQIGVVNIADTSSGYSIGLFSYVRKGIHQLTVSANEMLPLNVGYRSGNRKLYSILVAGLSPDPDRKAYSVGYGIGREWLRSGHWSFSTELSAQGFYLGRWDHVSGLYRLQTDLQVQLWPGVALLAGPSFNIYHSRGLEHEAGYRTDLPASGLFHFSVADPVSGWLGGHIGLGFF